MWRGVHPRKAAARGSVEDSKTLDWPFGGCLGCNKECCVGRGIEPLRDGPPTILRKEPRCVQGSRLRTGHRAQPVPPHGQDPFIDALPCGGERGAVLPVRHTITVSPGLDRQQGTRAGLSLCLLSLPGAWIDPVEQGGPDDGAKDRAESRVACRAAQQEADDAAQHGTQKESPAVSGRFALICRGRIAWGFAMGHFSGWMEQFGDGQPATGLRSRQPCTPPGQWPSESRRKPPTSQRWGR